jgi:DMSO/TMAO reductase YedYZ molybdopterin-dependent catalytic subunit
MLANWELEVKGLVKSPKTFSFADVLELPRTDQVTDFHCVEGWSVYDVPWNGIQLSELLAQAGPLPAATHVNFRTVGEKYNESLPLSVALESKTLLAYGVGGSTIPFAHGFPLRVVIPRLLGYKNAKYIHRIELAETPLHGYWIKAGYPYAGEVPQQRLRDGKY